MQEIRRRIVERLTADGTLYPSLVPGGIYDRPIKAGQGQGSTPAAFYITPGDPARIVRLHPSIVILGPNEVDPPSGPVDDAVTVLRNGFLRLFYYVPATATGKTLLDQIDARVRWLLHGWQPTLDVGYPLTLTALELSEPLDSDEFPGNLVCYRRFVGEYLRAVA
jgi:hypothetical protein